jgi:hypothetical protein
MRAQFRHKNLESFDPATQEIYQLLPTTIHTQSEAENLKQKSKTRRTRDRRQQQSLGAPDPANRRKLTRARICSGRKSHVNNELILRQPQWTQENSARNKTKGDELVDAKSKLDRETMSLQI